MFIFAALWAVSSLYCNEAYTYAEVVTRVHIFYCPTHIETVMYSSLDFFFPEEHTQCVCVSSVPQLFYAL